MAAILGIRAEEAADSVRSRAGERSGALMARLFALALLALYTCLLWRLHQSSVLSSQGAQDVLAVAGVTHLKDSHAPLLVGAARLLLPLTRDAAAALGLLGVLGSVGALLLLRTLGEHLIDRAAGERAMLLGAGSPLLLLCAATDPAQAVGAMLSLLCIWLGGRTRWSPSLAALTGLCAAFLTLTAVTPALALMLLPFVLWASARTPLFVRLMILPAIGLVLYLGQIPLPRLTWHRPTLLETPGLILTQALCCLPLALPLLLVALPRAHRRGLRLRDERVQLLLLALVPATVALPWWTAEPRMLAQGLLWALAAAWALGIWDRWTRLWGMIALSLGSAALLLGPATLAGRATPSLASLWQARTFWESASELVASVGTPQDTLVLTPQGDAPTRTLRLPDWRCLNLPDEEIKPPVTYNARQIATFVVLGRHLSLRRVGAIVVAQDTLSRRRWQLRLPPGARVGTLKHADVSMLVVRCPAPVNLRQSGFVTRLIPAQP